MNVLAIENLQSTLPYHKLTCTRNDKSFDLLYTPYTPENQETAYDVQKIENVTLVVPASRKYDPVSKRCVALPDFSHAGWILGDDVALNRIVWKHGLHELIVPGDQKLATATTHLVCLTHGDWSIQMKSTKPGNRSQSFRIVNVTGDAVRVLNPNDDTVHVLTIDGKPVDEQVIYGVQINNYVTLAVRRVRKSKNTPKDDVLSVKDGDDIVLSTFDELFDDPYPDTYRRFEIVGKKQLKATFEKVELKKDSITRLNDAIPFKQTNISLPPHKECFELFPRTLSSGKTLMEILDEKKYGRVEDPENLDDSPTLNCKAVSLLIVEYFCKKGIAADIFLSNKHAVVRVRGRFFDGTQHLKGGTQQKRNYTKQDIEQLLDDVGSDAEIIVNDYLSFYKINNRYYTWYPDDKHLERDVEPLTEHDTKLTANKSTPSVKVQQWAELWSTATNTQQPYPAFVIEQQLRSQEGDATIIVDDDLSFTKEGDNFYTIRNGNKSDGIQGININVTDGSFLEVTSI